MMGYGTGAIMAVPAHDDRDYEFAKKFDLPIIEVVRAPEGVTYEGCYTGEGTSINSGPMTGLSTQEFREKIIKCLEETHVGKRKIQYKLRDWLFSRQRYWGEPFPITWKDEKQHQGISETDLPLQLPELEDFKPTGTGEPPLAKSKDWVRLPDGSLRETNTMPQWAGSCWYYLRYLDPKNDQKFCDPEKSAYWLGAEQIFVDFGITGTAHHKKSIENLNGGVDLYVGGTEHAVLHLLYARFWHKVLYDLGHLTVQEPFYKLVNQGIILGEDGQKMSKSRGNVINPDLIISEHGADSMRLYEMFMGPLEQTKPWSMTGVEGVYRFLGRVWRFFTDEKSTEDFDQKLTLLGGATSMATHELKEIKLHPKVISSEPTREQLILTHKTIKKVTDDFENMSFNTAISALMIFINEAMTWENRPISLLKIFLQLLNPLAPHLAEELWEKMGLQECINYSTWPDYDEKYLVEDEVEIVLQLNGKLRDKIKVAKGLSQEDLKAKALENPKIIQLIEGREIRKAVVVPDKLVNIVVG
jgi:leucyl-tRNA synthetase